MQWLGQVLASLSRCPVCKEQASTRDGCCQRCANEMFTPQLGAFQISLGVYEGRLEQAVRALKFRHTTQLADLFGRQLAKLSKAQGWHIDVICDVPLHPKRRRERGYNQSELIASVVAKGLQRPYQTVLERTRFTQQQALLSQQERVDNVQQAFKATRQLPGQHMLLIDDVMTSGATTTECALVLLEAGAAQVYIATVARAG